MKPRITHCLLLPALCLLLLAGLTPAGSQPAHAQTDPAPQTHLVQPGDTWPALAYRYGVAVDDLQAANPHPNPLRQPTIGDTIPLPAGSSPEPRLGQLQRVAAGGLLRLAILQGQNPWQLAAELGLASPYQPLFGQPRFFPGGQTPPQEFPAGFHSLELSAIPAQPGRAIAYRAQATAGLTTTAQLNALPLLTFTNGQQQVGLGGTGAFYPAGAPELLIVPAGGPAWSQPWRFSSGDWDYDRVTLTGAAAAIDQEAIAAERARLFELWSQVSPVPQWQGPFQLPITQYLSVSSNYGARRSYNDGPFSTYHEGVDFSAYGGTPVSAPAGGTVVLAEQLYVRGGAVIIDHGLGIYSGFYHLSAVLAQPGQQVQAGDIVGEVGTTGLSSGNHLHWDLLVNGVWVDAAAWLAQDLPDWLLAGGGW